VCVCVYVCVREFSSTCRSLIFGDRLRERREQMEEGKGDETKFN